MGKDFLCGTLFDHTARVHNDNVVRHFGNNAEVVGDQHNGGVDLILQAAQQVQNLCLDGNIQRGGRLVRDDDLGVAGQRHGDHNALTHTAGQLVGVHLIHAVAVGNAYGFQHLDGALLDVLLALALALVQGNDLVDLGADAEHRVQAGHRLLEDHRNIVAAQTLHLFGGGLGNVIRLAVAEVQTDGTLHDLTLRALQQLHQRQAGDGLAAAGLADDADGLADGDFKGNTVHALDHAGIGEKVGVQVVELHRIGGVLHLGNVFRLRHIAALALLFVPVGNAAVFLGDTPRFFSGKIPFLFLSHRVFLLSISVSSWGQRRRADRHPQS